MNSVDNTHHNPPRVSVVMSVYNSERYLAQAVESILGQSFRDFEFIVIDDGSTDRSREIIEKYASRDRRIRLLVNRRNIGLTRSLNRGLEQARGEFIARQDADDISLPERFERQVEFLEAHPETGVLGTGYCLIDEAGYLIREIDAPLGPVNVRAELLVKNHALLHTSVMARSAVLREAGAYDETFEYAQDYDLWRRLSSICEMDNLPGRLLEWRVSPHRISAVRRKEQLECMLRTSLALMGDSPVGGDIDTGAYSALWWAYHGYMEKIDQRTILELTPLWDYLGSIRDHLSRTLAGFENLVYSLILNGKYRTGFTLRGILGRKMAVEFNNLCMAKNMIKSARYIMSRGGGQ